MYGAVSGATDGGFGGWDVDVDTVWLLANGTVDWTTVYSFGYRAHRELAVLGKRFTNLFYGMNDTRLYSYYQACSEGAVKVGRRFNDMLTSLMVLQSVHPPSDIPSSRPIICSPIWWNRRLSITLRHVS